jgi:WD40 repeat protein/transcriptional regulator with XRE-family HTH domain
MPVSSIKIALDQFTTFGDLLRYLRRRAGLTQRELSIVVGYSDAQISRLEQNQRMPDLATLTARIIPALHAEDLPEVATRLLELAAAVRREDAPSPGLPPYKGLYFFDEADADLFFGRDALIETLTDHLTNRLDSDLRFLAVVGASGSGKSSVVRAGLIQSLRWNQSSSGWPILMMTPSAHPLDALATSLQGKGRRDLSTARLVDDLSRRNQTLQLELERLTKAAGSSHALLVVDQFEELFTLCRRETEQISFVENLLTAAQSPNRIAMIVIVLRADFYAHCAKFDSLRQALAQCQEYIGPMTAIELRQAIEGPAHRGHWKLEEGLVNLLLHDVGADPGRSPEPGALPLLSHALLATWQRRRAHLLTLSGYTSSGGVRGAIAETAESVFQDQLDTNQRAIARQIFLRLTEFGDDPSTADTRRKVQFDELTTKHEDKELVQEVLITLADARLITMEQNSVEVSHEALIREWPMLRNWLDENHEGLRIHRHLTEASQEWEAMARDPGALYRGGRLIQTREWSYDHPNDLNPLEQAFLDASQENMERETAEREAQRQRALEAAQKLAETQRMRAEEQSKSNHRLRQQAWFLIIAFFIAGALAFTAIIFGRRAVTSEQLAISRELAAAAINQLDVDPERSVLLALQAMEESNTLEAQNALRRSLPDLHLLFTIPAGHARGSPGIAYSPDGSQLASEGIFGKIKIWDTATGNLLFTIPGKEGDFASDVIFSPDGKLLAYSGLIHVDIYNTETWKKAFTLSGESVGTTSGYNLGVGQISFSPDGTRLAVANMDGIPKVWDLATRNELMSLTGQEQIMKGIAYSPDGLLLATGGDAGNVLVWDATSGEILADYALGGIIHAVAFSMDGHLAAASENGFAKIWDLNANPETVSLPPQSGYYSLTFLPDGRLVTAGQDGTARVWDSFTGQGLLTLAGHQGTVIDVASAPEGGHVATSGYDGTVKVWDTNPGRELLTIAAHQAIVGNVVYSPDGSHIASASVDGTAKLWDAESGHLLITFSQGSEPGDGFASLAFHPDGKILATGSLDGSVTFWDLDSETSLNHLKGHSNMVVGLAFSPNGSHLASASWDGTAKVWDVSSGEQITSFTGHSKNALLVGIAFSPDGNQVFSTGGDSPLVQVWDAETGQQLGNFPDEDKDVYGLALSPDGTTLALGNQDGEITVWNVASGELLHRLTGHAGLIYRLEFSQDGQQLASASFDRLAKVWDISSGKEIATLFGNQGNVFGVAFSPDGAHLATAGADGTVRTYTLRLDNLVELARSRVTRKLTNEECYQFLHQDMCP